jgi:hypothetical protein
VEPSQFRVGGYQTNLDLRQVVFLPPETRGSIAATQQTPARVLKAAFANQSVSIQTEAPAPSLVVISQSHYPRLTIVSPPSHQWGVLADPKNGRFSLLSPPPPLQKHQHP